jgi:hypothetical protein
MKALALAVVLAVSTLIVDGHAQTVYRCVTPKGVVYQDSPCPEGKQSVPDLVDYGAHRPSSVGRTAPGDLARVPGRPKTDWGKIRIGMSIDDAYSVFHGTGDVDSRNVTEMKGLKSEQWVMKEYCPLKYLYFRNGVLETIQR